MALPPLLGDSQGQYRVHLTGNSGVGKSTLGKELAGLLGVPFISIDTLFWTPGWGHRTNEELRAKVEEALADAPNGWVIDGNYTSKIGNIIHDSSTDTIWLDPPLALYVPRVIWRTFLRLLGLRELCSPGCPEDLTKLLFSKESIIWLAITQHRTCRARETARMARIGIGMGSNVEGQKMRRLGGWGEEYRAWLNAVKSMLQRK
ncbi:hypothetical protein C8R46DRAFT_1172042 [Mycena filopes]|nr:hypothetical protein C8R46DRAFT_1172042 [Mycena filopes]